MLVSILDVGVFTVATRYVLDQASADLSERGAKLLATELAGAPREEWSAVVDRYRRSGLRDVTVYDPTGHVLAGEAIEAERAVREAMALRDVTSGDADGAVYAVAPIGGSSPLGAVRFELPRTTTAVPRSGKGAIPATRTRTDPSVVRHSPAERIDSISSVNDRDALRFEKRASLSPPPSSCGCSGSAPAAARIRRGSARRRGRT